MDAVELARRVLILHQQTHKVYGSTAVCWGGIGGAMMTEHCHLTCSNPKHEGDRDDWRALLSDCYSLVSGKEES